MRLRTPDDVRRLFSALGDELTHESGALSVTDVDEAALEGITDWTIDPEGLMISLFVAAVTGWAAIKGYSRNNDSISWGLTWSALGFMFPIPTLVYSAIRE